MILHTDFILHFVDNLHLFFKQSTSQVLTRGAAQRSKVQTRAMVNKDLEKKEQQRNRIGFVAENMENGKKSSITLTEAKQKAREKKQRQPESKSCNSEVPVKDIYQNVNKKILQLHSTTAPAPGTRINMLIFYHLIGTECHAYKTR